MLFRSLWAVKNRGRIGYTRDGTVRLSALGTPGALPLATDCSGFATFCYSWARAPNPNAAGPFDARAGAYTGTMLDHCRRIPKSAAQPGDHYAGQNRSHQAGCCVGAAGYAKGQRQRQRDRPNRQPGQQITPEDRPVIFCKLAPPDHK